MGAAGEVYSVTGGAAGHEAMTEDLRVAVSAITVAADRLAEVTGHASRVLSRVEDLGRTVAWDVPFFAGVDKPMVTLGIDHAAGTLSQILSGPAGSRCAEDALLDIADRLAATVAQLEASETAAHRAMSLRTRAVAAAQDLRGFGALGMDAAHVLITGQALASASPAQFMAKYAAAGLPGTTGLLNRDTVEVGRHVPRGAAAGFTAVIAFLTSYLERLLGEPVFVWAAQWRELEHPPAAPQSLEDAVWFMEAAWSQLDGSVLIQEIPGPDGPQYLVCVPGTQDDGWGASPSDWNSNFELMTSGMSDSLRMVLAAMERAGIPADAPVMLMGHSQGGIVATALAASPQFASRFNVTHVVTAGSPTGLFTLPPGVKALHLEHAEDVTPGLDLKPNPAGANRTTFTRSLTQSPDPRLRELGQTIPGAHVFEGYAATARLAESGVSASVDEFMASAKGFFTPMPGTNVQAYSPVTVPAG